MFHDPTMATTTIMIHVRYPNQPVFSIARHNMFRHFSFRVYDVYDYDTPHSIAWHGIQCTEHRAAWSNCMAHTDDGDFSFLLDKLVKNQN
jgi:hypothetical protein